MKSGGTTSGQSGNVVISTGGAGGTTPTGSLTLSTGFQAALKTMRRDIRRGFL